MHYHWMIVYMPHLNIIYLFSEPFPHTKDVQQGCNLSPLLFSLFMNDLEGFLKSHSSGFCTLNNCMLQLLMYADDLVLLADTANALQEPIKSRGIL